MLSTDLRSSFLTYFERHGHRVVSSASLVPHDDPTLLFTNAGMNQFKDTFLGREPRAYTRATTSQKCMRVSGKHNDLDNVGPSFRHHTFFEMLGNFSFGDYFKDEAIPLAWQLLTGEWALDPNRLFATVFRGDGGVPRDDRAFEIWRRFLPAEHIGELGAADNFWQMGDTGPCGRCSEIYVFRGTGVPCGEEARGGRCLGLECSCDRFVEIWNNVFMEFDRQADGTLIPLPAPSIDTGMGLERIAAVMNGVLSNYDTDLFEPLLAAIGERTGHRYDGTMASPDVSMRVVADHMRAMTFLIADGVVPSNEWRGYVLRKIMRRAMRHGMRLGRTEPFLYTLVDVLVAKMGAAYPELRADRDAVAQVIRSEEERFDAVLTGGLPKLEEVLDRAAATTRTVAGQDAFRLYDTYGLPLDFIEDLASERKMAVDRMAFDEAMATQREKARAKSAFDGRGGHDVEFRFVSDAAREALRTTPDQFEGYTATTVKGIPVVALFDENREQVIELAKGARGYVVLARTPFYLEAGGQVSDSGRLYSEAGADDAAVTGVVRTGSGFPRAHQVRVVAGTLRERALLTADVDAVARDATRRNHTATHLLHAALRQVLGPHVKQAGSLVAPDRLRFDFMHFSAVTREQQLDVERLVNAEILKDTPVQTELKSQSEAVASGAMALFGEKYGDVVRVVSVPGFSLELCGGTHVAATGHIGLFAFTSEGGVAAGVRRIEAITGMNALARYQEQRSAIEAVSAALSVTAEQAGDAIARLQAEAKRLARELQQAKMQAVMDSGTGTGSDAAVQIGGATLVAREVPPLDKDALREIVDKERDRIRSGVVVLACATTEGKVSIVVGVTPDLIKKAPAGQIVKKLAVIVGGSGGGRPDFAEAGGRDPSKIGEMLDAAKAVVAEMLRR